MSHQLGVYGVAELTTPFGTEPVPEIPLARAPLTKVVAQVRFPPIASISRLEFLAPFQEALRGEYPVLRQEQEIGVIVTPGGVAASPSAGSVWRFANPENGWRVSLAPTFLALDTSDYSNRSDFLDRLRAVLKTFEDHVHPQLCDRFGVRFVNHITGAELDDLPKLVRQEALGMSALRSEQAAELLQSVSITVFSLHDTRLQVRYGIVPASSTVDPGMEPLAEPAWLLDIDMFDGVTRPFDPLELETRARQFCDQTYRFFRWTVTDRFIRTYGGKP